MADHLTAAERDMVKSLNEIGGLSAIEERLLEIVERLDVKLKRADAENTAAQNALKAHDRMLETAQNARRR